VVDGRQARRVGDDAPEHAIADVVEGEGPVRPGPDAAREQRDLARAATLGIGPAISTPAPSRHGTVA
jgi:hypothetical protein